MKAKLTLPTDPTYLVWLPSIVEIQSAIRALFHPCFRTRTWDHDEPTGSNPPCRCEPLSQVYVSVPPRTSSTHARDDRPSRRPEKCRPAKMKRISFAPDPAAVFRDTVSVWRRTLSCRRAVYYTAKKLPNHRCLSLQGIWDHRAATDKS